MSIIKMDGEDEYKRIIHKDFSKVEAAQHDAAEEVEERRQRLEKAAPTLEGTLGDKVLPAHQQHSIDFSAFAPRKNFDEKIYMFPPSFNALREELETYFPTFFHSIDPEFGISPAWAMVYNAPQFIGIMNGALDMVIQVDTGDVEGICKKFLNALRAKRGVSPL